jgi:hypothetical protein
MLVPPDDVSTLDFRVVEGLGVVHTVVIIVICLHEHHHFLKLRRRQAVLHETV